jgi:hypothetical protein
LFFATHEFVVWHESVLEQVSELLQEFVLAQVWELVHESEAAQV